MPEMVSLQSFTLRSLTGHTRCVQARIPCDIPDVMVEEAMARGMVPTSEAGIPLEHSKNPKARKAAPFGEERQTLILRKIEEFVTRSRTEQNLFTGSGAPNAKIMGQELGFQISTKERNEVWGKYKIEGAPKVPTVLTIEDIVATAPKRGGISAESVETVKPAAGVTDAEEMTLDEVLEQTGMEDNTDGAFSGPPKDE